MMLVELLSATAARTNRIPEYLREARRVPAVVSINNPCCSAGGTKAPYASTINTFVEYIKSPICVTENMRPMSALDS